jgi:hypothetical protein
MGDRVSISFRKEEERWSSPNDKEKITEESPVLFHHWGGTDFPKFAFDWFKALRKHLKKNHTGSDPLTRLEPRNLMVQFINAIRDEEAFRLRHYENKTKDINGGTWSIDDNLLSYSIYLGKDSMDGDNSDNGHYLIDVDKGKMYNDKGESIE